MSLFPQESNDEEMNSKFSFLDKTIYFDLQSLSSESSIEEPISPIKTNLNEAQLVMFQSYNNDDESNLSICPDENPIWIEFKKEDINNNVSIELIKPDKDEKHDKLKLVLVNNQYMIHNGEIIFNINQEPLKLNLDFFGIKFTDDHENNLDTDKVYNRNTARLSLKKYDNSENLITSYKSKIIRNKNFDVSEDISILQIKRQEKHPTKYILKLDFKVPYFPHEMIIEIDGYDTNCIPTTTKGFPISDLLISVHEKIKCTLSNTRIICKIFQKESIPKQIKQNTAIEIRKKKNKKKKGETETSQTNSSALVQESKETKEMCLVINQTIFDDESIKSRELHSESEILEIKNVFSKTLNYDVYIFKNLGTQELKDKINNKLDNFENYHDHIVVFVFSHGDNNMFHTRDGFITYNDFVKLFLPINCQKISDKPKLFFISCCLGKKVNTIDKSYIPQGITENTSASCENLFKYKNLPEYSNIFMGFSTVPDYYSFRVNNFTPYIQTLLDVIRENPTLEVRNIQNITQSRINWKESLTIPSVFHCLNRDVFFKQKINP
uniref:Caspase-1 n=1 Tax=Dugesia japonica TaxID=6161 RepID=A0A4Y6I2B1_DUGJA|nr:caspase-1 [Dugesia japonica]